MAAIQVSEAELARAMYDQDMAYAPVLRDQVLPWNRLTMNFYGAKARALCTFVAASRRSPSNHPLDAQ